MSKRKEAKYKKEILYDEVAKVWYTWHNRKRYDYYCPYCHVEYYPDREDGIVAYDYEKQWSIKAKDLAEKELKIIEYGGCIYCDNNPAYMVIAEEGDY